MSSDSAHETAAKNLLSLAAKQTDVTEPTTAIAVAQVHAILALAAAVRDLDASYMTANDISVLKP